MTVMFFLLFGCPKPIVLNTEPDAQSEIIESVVELDPAGRLTDDTFIDFDHDLVVPILDGWTFEIGKRNEAFRLRLKHVSESGLEIEFWSFEGRYDEPIPSERCQWSFVDNGYYSQYSISEKTIVASCEYNYQSNLVFAVLIPTEAQTWQVEIHTPSLNMISNLNNAHQQLRQASIIRSLTSLSTDEYTEQNHAEK